MSARRLDSGNVNVVEAVDLRRTYRITTGTLRRRSRDVEAVRGVSFSIREGELFGLLGPNGAGKTTTIKMLNTLLIPTCGQAHVLGFDVVRDARRVREQIGYVFGGDRGLYERLSALDNLRYFAELYGVEPRPASGRGSGSSWRSSGSTAARESASRATAAACASGSTSRAACCTTRRCSSSTSPRSASTPSALASSAR